MNGLGGHYGKWNKPNVEKMLHDLTYMWNLWKKGDKGITYIEIENKTMITAIRVEW